MNSPADPERRRVLVLVGPTASGKTSVALPLARRLNGEVLSADSRQLFLYLDIGTAKPSAEERSQIPHHFIDLLPPDEAFSAGEFGVRGRLIIEQIFARGRTPIVVGGSGLYVRSLIDGFFEGPGASKEIREALLRRINEGGIEEVTEELKHVDPETAAHLDPTKPRRIVRALEVYLLTGRPLSMHQREGRVMIPFTPLQFGLEWERKILYERIDRRCEDMIKKGLLEEVARLEMMGYGPGLQALDTVGYAEAFRYRQGDLRLEEMVSLFKRNSRRYAKRQLTWFRADRRIRWIPMREERDPADVAAQIERMFLAG